MTSAPAPITPAHRVTFWRTLRFRLAVWNALIVALTAGITLAGLRQGVQWTLLHELDQILTEDLEEVELAVRETGTGDLVQLTDHLTLKAIGHKQHQWFVELRGPEDDVLWRSEGTPESIQDAVVTARSPITVDGYRVVEHRIEGSPRISSARVGASLELMQQDIQRLDGLVLIAGILLLLIAPLLGYWLARRAAQTIGDIIHTASHLNPGRLEDRLRILGTGDELDQLSHTVNHLLDRIAAYLQQRREYLANIAHELRTPLAAVRSSVEVALVGDRSPQEYQDLLGEIIEQGESLESLVNQILLLAEAEADDLMERTEPVDLREVAETSVDMFRGVAEVRGIWLQTQRIDVAVIPGRRTHLSQLVNNLIDNAVKYTPQGGRIDVSLVRDPEAGEVTLTVRDTGIGIAKSDIERIFDRFFRADRSRLRDPSVRGSGLGLSICKAIVAAHHGEIVCASEIGKGTTFTVHLPLG